MLILRRPTDQDRIFDELSAFGVVVLKQILPFKSGSYGQPLGLRLPGFRRYVVFGRVEGRG